MRYVMFSLPGDAGPRLGVLNGANISDAGAAVSGKWPGRVPTTLLELIQSGPDAWRRMSEAVGSAKGAIPVDGIRWYAPIPRPTKNIFCVGLNYLAHAKESSAARGRETKIPQVPVFFTKAPTAVNGPYDPIPWDRSATEQVDYEAELGVIVGAAGKNLKKSDALQHVFGYTIVNDVSARDVQMRHLQYFKGKSLDGFCPMGPSVVTADEFGDPQKKHITLRVNGVTKQDSTTADMMFTVDAILEHLSRGLTLEPGDIVATGTPEGVGLGRTPPEYLNDGDVVETEIEGIGVMRNQVVVV